MSATILALLALSAPAPSVGVLDLGTEVGVMLSGVSAADGRLSTEKDRIEIILGQAVTPTVLDVSDRLVKKVEILADPPRLSIQTRYGPRSTTKFARGGVLETVEGGIRVRLSRDLDRTEVERGGQPRTGTIVAQKNLDVPGTPVIAAAPVTPTAAPIAAAAAPIAAAPIAAAAAPAVTPPAPAAVAPFAPTAAAPAAEVAPTADASERPAPPLDGSMFVRKSGATASKLGKSDDDGLGKALTWVTVLGLMGAAAVLIRTAQKRKQGTVDKGEVTVISTRALSPKVKVVLVGVAGRQLLLSVADKGAELLTEITPEEDVVPARKAIAKAASNFARIAEEEQAAAEARFGMNAPAAPAAAPAPAALRAVPATSTRDLPRLDENMKRENTSPALDGLLALRARATGTDEVRTAWNRNDRR